MGAGKSKRIETLYEGKHLSLRRQGNWEYADREKASGVVAIVAITKKDELVLTEQYRVPVRKKVVDLPAGLAGDIPGEENEEMLRAAKRELLEETGYQAQSFQHIFTGPTSPGLSTEMIDFFLATDAEQVADGGGDETEDIKTFCVPLEKTKKWLKRKSTTRTCIDVKVYAALGIIEQYRSS